jgi:hypothetical protein
MTKKNKKKRDKRTERRRDWYKKATLSNFCSHDTRCASAEPDGNCDCCDTIDGRWITAVNEYASTCDLCGELTSHDAMEMDEETQLGYCESCTACARKTRLLK